MFSINPYETQEKELVNGMSALIGDMKFSDFYKGNWVLDVGCNIGVFIDHFLTQIPNVNILAFEPVKAYYNHCLTKYKDHSNIYFENAALSDMEGNGEIYVASKNIGWNTMISEATDEDNRETRQQIKTICFDRYYDYTGLSQNEVKFDFVKIDVEGYEYKVLQGMKNFLREQKPAILCEIGWGKGHPHWDEELQAFEYLYSIGYSREHEEEIQNLSCTKDFLFRST